MLTITIPAVESFDDSIQEFVTTASAITLQLEHSLVSLSKWESIWEKPFIGKDTKTDEETYSYIECMCLTPEIAPEVFRRLTNGNIEQINAYIEANRSATWFNEASSGSTPRSREVITSELMYYWMVTFQIPFECETWHLNRLLTLIKVCDQKNQPEKKVAPQDAAAERARLNAERRAKYNTAG